MIDKKKLNQLKQYFAGQPVDAVYLFGSQASQKATKLSDADFGVLFKEGLSKSDRFEHKLDMTSRLAGILKLERVDVVDLQEAPMLAGEDSTMLKEDMLLTLHLAIKDADLGAIMLGNTIYLAKDGAELLTKGSY